MPKKPKRPEAEIHAMIEREAKMRLGCADFGPDFTIQETRDPRANWEARGVDPAGWLPD